MTMVDLDQMVKQAQFEDQHITDPMGNIVAAVVNGARYRQLPHSKQKASAPTKRRKTRKQRKQAQAVRLADERRARAAAKAQRQRLHEQARLAKARHKNMLVQASSTIPRGSAFVFPSTTTDALRSVYR